MKLVIWKFNFSNSFNFQRSSRNIRFDSYSEKEILFLHSLNYIIIKYTERQRLSQRGHKNRCLHFNFVFCEMLIKIIVLKQAIKKKQFYSSSIYVVKDTKFLSFGSIYHPSTILQNMFVFHICNYSDCCFLCAASKIVVFVNL